MTECVSVCAFVELEHSRCTNEWHKSVCNLCSDTSPNVLMCTHMQISTVMRIVHALAEPITETPRLLHQCSAAATCSCNDSACFIRDLSWWHVLHKECVDLLRNSSAWLHPLRHTPRKVVAHAGFICCRVHVAMYAKYTSATLPGGRCL